MKKALIEKWFPIREISRDAAIEMAYKAIPAYIKHCRELKISERRIREIGRDFYDPKIRSLHPWFARRPCSVSRALTLGAILPSEIDKNTFMKAIGWDNKSKACIVEGYPPILFYVDPDRNLIHQLLIRYLGKKPEEIIVCDPMAGGGSIPLESLRLGFKSIAIDYNPVAYLILKGTIEYPSLFGDKLAKLVNKEFKRLISYSKEVLGKFYPDDSEGYIIARGVKCQKCGGKIPLIRSTQINSNTYILLHFNSRKKFEVNLTRYSTKLPYESEKRGEIICPYCNALISKKEAYKIWTKTHVEILNELERGVINEEKILSTYILLVRQTKKKEKYIVCNENDNYLFLEACKTLMESFKKLKKYIPLDKIPDSNEVFSNVKKYGIKYWYELFNPRQLLVIGTLIKYARERCEELLSQGKLGAAISLYLAFGISKVVDYNSILTSWKQGTIRDSIGSYAQGRKITYSEWFCEAIVPYRNLNWIFEPELTNKKKTEGGIYPIVNELCKRIGGLGKNAIIINGDCRSLSSLLNNVKVDVINVDPPYFDTHIYSDISEYFWQIFRIILEPYIGKELVSTINGWNPKSAQVPREGEIIVRKNKRSKNVFDKEWYTKQMSVFFKECYKTLKDEGILLVWFTHRSLDAWETVINALCNAEFYVTRIWPVTSELLTRLVTKGNGSTLNRTLIIVARKRKALGEIKETELKDHVIRMMEEMRDALSELNVTEIEINTFLQAAAMCAVTRVQNKEKNIQKLISQAKKIAREYIPKLLEEKHVRKKTDSLVDFLIFE